MERATPDSELVLASASPRRRELLALLGVPFVSIATDAEETDNLVAPAHVVAAVPPCPLRQTDHPTLLAWHKVQAVVQSHNARVVLGADTTVVLDGMILNKPTSADHAAIMLRQLSGQEHTVYTGLCVYARTEDALSVAAPPNPQSAARTWSMPHTGGWVFFDLVASRVTMAPLLPEEIAAYVATGEPMDKAGAYGIQGIGGTLVRQVVGSYTSVVGLPLTATRDLLAAAGISGLADPTIAYHSWLHAQGKEPLPCPPTLP